MSLNSPKNPPQSLTAVFASRLARLEKKVAEWNKNGVSKTRGGARLRQIEITGTGSATFFNINHELNNQWVIISAAEKDSPYSVYELTIELTDENNAKITFTSAPANGKEIVITIIG